ncbi:MAG: hypothetical protein LAO03_17765 [Acidobacteriia bacterium]|nr:hypothetical protein [Terriglobia bacterium]
MRKLAVLSIVVLALIASGATPALAAGPFCLHFVNFCDDITTTTDNSGNNGGTWDWTCDDITLTSVLGIQSAGLITSATRPVDANGVPFTYTTNFAFNKKTLTFNLWATDGTTTFPLQLGQPYTLSAGVCSSSDAHNGKKPSISGLQ